MDTDINEMYALISPVYGKSQASELYGVSFIGPHKETTSRYSTNAAPHTTPRTHAMMIIYATELGGKDEVGYSEIPAVGRVEILSTSSRRLSAALSVADMDQ